MLISSETVVLAFALGGLVGAELYFVQKDDSRLLLELPESEDISFRDVATVLEGLSLGLESLSNLHFDRVTDALEVLSLPREILAEHLSPNQLIEIIMNPAMDQVLDNTFLLRDGKGSERKDLLKKKQKMLFQQFETLTPENLGGLQDQVIARIPGRLYRFLRPMTVLTANTVKMSVRNLQSLFHITARTLVKLTKGAASALLSTFKFIRSLGVTPLGVIQTVDVLLGLVLKYPEINVMIPRVYLLAKELDEMAHFITRNAAVFQSITRRAIPVGPNDPQPMDTTAKCPKSSPRSRVPRGWVNWTVLKKRSDLPPEVKALVKASNAQSRPAPSRRHKKHHRSKGRKSRAAKPAKSQKRQRRDVFA